MTDYAETLRVVAKEGPGALYGGELGRLIAVDFAANGGLITEEDFRQYRLRIRAACVVELPRLHGERLPAAGQRRPGQRDAEHPRGLRPRSARVRNSRILSRDGPGPEGPASPTERRTWPTQTTWTCRSRP